MAKTLFGAFLGVAFGEAAEQVGDDASRLCTAGRVIEADQSVAGVGEDVPNFAGAEHLLADQLIQKESEDSSSFHSG